MARARPRPLHRWSRLSASRHRSRLATPRAWRCGSKIPWTRRRRIRRLGVGRLEVSSLGFSSLARGVRPAARAPSLALSAGGVRFGGRALRATARVALTAQLGEEGALLLQPQQRAAELRVAEAELERCRAVDGGVARTNAVVASTIVIRCCLRRRRCTSAGAAARACAVRRNLNPLPLIFVRYVLSFRKVVQTHAQAFRRVDRLHAAFVRDQLASLLVVDAHAAANCVPPVEAVKAARRT
eukprot:2370099-Pleurochrysis_carterae.AAC.2